MRNFVAALAATALVFPLAFTAATVAPHAAIEARAQARAPAPPPAPADPAEASRKALAPLAPLVGSFKFSRPDGYEKTFENAWALDGTALLWRSKTVIPGGEVVYEDLTVVSHDATRNRVRARQWANGACSTYDVEVSAGGKIVMTEVETEGVKPEPWRYTITTSEDGFKYAVEKKAGEGWKAYIGHEVKKVK